MSSDIADVSPLDATPFKKSARREKRGNEANNSLLARRETALLSQRLAGFFFFLSHSLFRRLRTLKCCLFDNPHTRRLYPSLGVNTARSLQFAHQSVCVAPEQQLAAQHDCLTAALTDWVGWGPPPAAQKLKKSKAKIKKNKKRKSPRVRLNHK